MPKKDPGKIVKMKDGTRGRTYNSKKPIDGKIIVYKEIEPHKYSTAGILCAPETLTLLGYID